MKTFLKIWPVVYAAVGHPWMLGFFCMVMTLLQPTDSLSHLEWYVAMCAFMAAGLTDIWQGLRNTGYQTG